MSTETKKTLEQKLWDIANTLRGKMGADEFRDYILGFIFYKYLSEKMHLYANQILNRLVVNILKSKKALPMAQLILKRSKKRLLKSLDILKPSNCFIQWPCVEQMEALFWTN